MSYTPPPIDLRMTSQHNLRVLRDNTYPGRVSGGGLTLDGKLVLIACTGGRSADSRDRKFIIEGNTVTTTSVSGKALSEDLIYPSISQTPSNRRDVLIATNGHQTMALLQSMGGGVSHATVLRDWDFESDGFTPRISTTIDLYDAEKPLIEISSITRSPINPNESDRRVYQKALFPGAGFIITTYAGNGQPPPVYMGEPLLIAMPNTGHDIIESIWSNLDPDTRVSIAVRMYDHDGRIEATFIKNGDDDIEESHGEY